MCTSVAGPALLGLPFAMSLLGWPAGIVALLLVRHRPDEPCNFLRTVQYTACILCYHAPAVHAALTAWLSGLILWGRR